MKSFFKLTDTAGYVYTDNIQVKTFSGGEVQTTVTGLDSSSKYILTANIRDSDGIICLLQILDTMQNLGNAVILKLPYIPFARQDRRMVEGDSFSLNVFVNLLREYSTIIKKIIVFDPHSDVSTAVLENVAPVFVVSQDELVIEKVNLEDYDVLVSPDAGAYKKVLKVANKTYPPKRVVVALKARDVATGAITHTAITESVEGLKVLICDDICDGGRTFIELAKALKQAGAIHVSLYVTHGIFSRGLQPLVDSGIDKIYTAINWLDDIKPVSN
jgi:ribose-phosphate pyrophosphokinase